MSHEHGDSNSQGGAAQSGPAVVQWTVNANKSMQQLGLGRLRTLRGASTCWEAKSTTSRVVTRVH